MKSTQDLVCFLRTLERVLEESGLSIQIYCDKSYRIYDSSANIIFDSEQQPFITDINDLPYEQEDYIATLIRKNQEDQDGTRDTSVQT